jgi:hypothetical protein
MFKKSLTPGLYSEKFRPHTESIKQKQTMRTNTLLLAAAIGVAGASSAFAQVYSVNAVGYVTLDLPSGFSIIANPLDAGAGNNTVEKLFTAVPTGTIIYKYGAAGYEIISFDPDLGGWDPTGKVINPGEGFWIRLPAATKVTFVGEVMQGTLSNPIPAGFSLKASQVPQAGKLQTDLKFPVATGDVVYKYSSPAGYAIASFDPDLGGWDPAEPTIGVGEGFWARKVAVGDWARTFSVNQ